MRIGLMMAASAVVVGGGLLAASWSWAQPAPGTAGMAASAAGKAETYKVDPVHSMIIFKIRHLDAGYVWGRFNEPTGTLVLDPADATRSRFEFSVPARNLDTHQDQRDAHLRSPQFFDVETFPQVTFKSTAVKKLDEKTYDLTGDLTLHGVTKPITVKAVYLGSGKGMAGETRAGFETSFTIKRSDFGMKTMLGPVGDEVLLMVGLEGIAQ